MTIGTFAMLVGVFGVPILLLALGHRLRRRPPRQRAIFWGTLVGYGIAAIASLWASMVPPATWSPNDTARGLLGFWSLIVGPALGAIAALFTPAARSR